MGTTNQGSQTIVYRYKTPLIASQLATALGHITNDGLIDIQTNVTNIGTNHTATLSITSFSMIIKCSNKIGNTNLSESTANRNETMFRITGKNLDIGGIGSGEYKSDCLILTFDYSFTGYSAGNPKLMDSWFGEFKLLTAEQFAKKLVKNENTINSIASATTPSYECNSDFQSYIFGVILKKPNGDYYFTTNGADWSGLALQEKGFDPKFWLSMSSPRRHVIKTQTTDEYQQSVVKYDNDFDRYFEVRTFNNEFNDVVPYQFGALVTGKQNLIAKIPDTLTDFSVSNHEIKITKHQTSDTLIFALTQNVNTTSLSIYLSNGTVASAKEQASVLGNAIAYVFVDSDDFLLQSANIRAVIAPRVLPKICKVTEAVFESLTTKDPDTIYIVY